VAVWRPKVKDLEDLLVMPRIEQEVLFTYINKGN